MGKWGSGVEIENFMRTRKSRINTYPKKDLETYTTSTLPHLIDTRGQTLGITVESQGQVFDSSTKNLENSRKVITFADRTVKHSK